MNFNIINLVPIRALGEGEIVKHNIHVLTPPRVQTTLKSKKKHG